MVRTGIAAGTFQSGTQTWNLHYVVSAMTTPYEMRLKIQRRNSSGTMQSESAYGTTRTATGTYDDAISWDSGTWNANDQLAVVWEHRRPSGTGSKNGTITANGSSYAEAPLSPISISSTESLAIHQSDIATITYVYRFLSDSFGGSVDDWRLLTDSSTFTNFNRTDDLVVRLNAPDLGGGGTTTVNATDVISIGLSDSAQLTSFGIFVSDFIAVQTNDSLNVISVTASVSESLVIGTSDIFTGSQSLSSIDATGIAVIEAVSIISSVSSSDTNSLSLSGIVSQTAAVLTASDSIATQASDSISSTAVNAFTNDAIASQASDSFTGSQSFSIADICSVQIASIAGISAAVSASDIESIQFSDSGSLSQSSISATDNISVICSDIGSSLQNALISTTDSCAIISSESVAITNAVSTLDSFATIITDIFIGSQALAVSDDFGSLLSEDQHSSLPSAASDNTATVLSEAASVSLSVGIFDALNLQIYDIGSQQNTESAIPKSVTDVCGIQIEEGAVTELAGPYWSGSTWEDRGLVYTDSYSMGRRENPRKMRW